MPYPKNVETALRVERTIRENGAVPATIAIIGGRLKAGLSEAEIEYLGKTGRAVAKVSRRDLPVIVATKADKIGKNARQKNIAAIRRALGVKETSILPYSSVKNEGRSDLLDVIRETLV